MSNDPIVILSALDTVKSWWAWLADRWTVDGTVLTGDSDYTWVIACIIFAVFGLTFTPLWRGKANIRMMSTILHEMGHSLVAMLTGRKLHGIKIHDDTSGVSVSSGKPHGIGMILTTFAGYPGPSIFAVIMALLAYMGLPGASLLFYNFVLIFAFFLCRNINGFIYIILGLLTTGVIQYFNHPEVVSWTVITLVIFYSVAAVADTFDLFRVHYGHWRGGIRKEQRIESREQRKTSDAHQLFKLTLVIPATAWIAIFFLTNVAGFVLSLYFLLT